MIRVYQQGDHKEIAQIFSRAVHEIASVDYNQEQCNAWCDKTQVNYEHWKKRCEFKRPFVAVTNSQISGFIELDTDGHIDCAYVNPNFMRQGIMTKLVSHVIKTAFEMKVKEIYVEASICIKPLFESLGFRLIREFMVDINGVKLRNYEMTLKNKLAEQEAAANHSS